MILTILLALFMIVAIGGLFTSLSGLKRPVKEMNRLIKSAGIEFNDKSVGLDRMKKQQALLNTDESARVLALYEKAIPAYLKWFRILIAVIAVFSIGCSAMMIVLIFLFPNAVDVVGKIFVSLLLLIDVVALGLVAPWIPRFKSNVIATDEGIGFEDQFFSWAEVTQLRSWFAGRIDVYTKKDSISSVFCFGIVFSAQEFREGYQHTYLKLLAEREKYQLQHSARTGD